MSTWRCFRRSLSRREQHRPIRPHDDQHRTQHGRLVDGNMQTWSAMKRTSTARSSMHSCSTRLVPQLSNIRPQLHEAGTLLSDEYSTCDTDDVFSVTESQLETTYLPNGK